MQLRHLDTDMYVNYIAVKEGWIWEIYCNGTTIKSQDAFYTKEMARRNADMIMTNVKRKASIARKGYIMDSHVSF